MAKSKSVFICSNCGNSSPKWLGNCPYCDAWNSFTEKIISQASKREEAKEVWRGKRSVYEPKILALDSIKNVKTLRISTGNREMDRVLGGGIVQGSLILLGGQPGIGKSTLLLQLALGLKLKVLYVSGEESEEQIKMRAERIGFNNRECYIFTETKINNLLREAKTLKPDLIIIDSIQTLSSSFHDSAPGSVSQLRECTADLQQFSKMSNIPVIIIGHITKEGSIAGPKLLEHIVDVVLQFEGDPNYSYRILRTQKNRFGSTDELGIFEMTSKGLKEVHNPSELLLSQTDENLSGSAVAATIEGRRPILIEVQSLVSNAIYGNPQRSATGFDLRRLSMLLAVLEKRCGLPFAQNDVFLNIAGGVRIFDPAIDLAIIAALVSSLDDIFIDKKFCFAGEIGLSGEVRAVSKIEQRVIEADRLGFHKIFISKYNMKSLQLKKYNLEVIGLRSVEHLLEELFA